MRLQSTPFLTLLFAAAVAVGANMPASAATVCQKDGPISSAAAVPDYEWSDDSSPAKGIVITVHGFCQEAMSTRVIAEDLAKRDYLVISMDMRGHGRWHTGPDAKKNIADYPASVKDLVSLCKAAKAAHPGLPLYCIGESTGSGVVSQAAASDKDLIDGIILSSPGTRPRCYNIFWLTSDFLSNIWRLDRPFKVHRYIDKYASNDQRVCDEMLNDPLDRKEMSGREIFRTLFWIEDTPIAFKHLRNGMPILVVQGAKDGIVVLRTVPALMKLAQSTDKKLVVFPKYGHVLVGTDYIKPDVQSTIDEWLDQRVTAPKLGVSGHLSSARTVSP